MKLWQEFCKIFTIFVLVVTFIIVTIKFSPSIFYVIKNHEITEDEINQIWEVAKAVFIIFLIVVAIIILNFIYKWLNDFLADLKKKRSERDIERKTKTLEIFKKLRDDLNKYENDLKITIKKFNYFQDRIISAFNGFANWVHLRFIEVFKQLTNTYPELLAFLQWIFGNEIKELGSAGRLEKFFYYMGTILILFFAIQLKIKILNYRQARRRIVYANIPIWCCFLYRIYDKPDLIDLSYYSISIVVFIFLIRETKKIKMNN